MRMAMVWRRRTRVKDYVCSSPFYTSVNLSFVLLVRLLLGILFELVAAVAVAVCRFGVVVVVCTIQLSVLDLDLMK